MAVARKEAKYKVYNVAENTRASLNKIFGCLKEGDTRAGDMTGLLYI